MFVEAVFRTSDIFKLQTFDEIFPHPFIMLKHLGILVGNTWEFNNGQETTSLPIISKHGLLYFFIPYIINLEADLSLTQW